MAANRVWLNLAWLIPRWCLWALLFVVAIVDGMRHRNVAATAGRLFWLLVLSTGLFLFRDTFLLAFSAEAQDGSWINRATFDAYIFFSGGKGFLQERMLWTLIVLPHLLPK